MTHTTQFPSQPSLELAQRVLTAHGIKRAPHLQRRLATNIELRGPELALRMLREALTVG